MTNTKFRKRALLSSVAMLLVALVALGSATFAWFAESPQAYAQGLSVKTTAAAGLDIMSHTQHVWGKSAILNFKNGATDPDAFNLVPASQCQNTTSGETVTGHAGVFYTTTAASHDAYGAKSDAKFTDGKAGVYSENVYFKLSSTASATASRNVVLKGVTLTEVPNAAMSGVIRVSVADSNNKLLGTYALNSAKPNQTIPYGLQSTDTITTITPVEFSPTLTATGTSGAAISTNVTAATEVMKNSGETKYVTVYVYLDGQDTDCKTDQVSDVDVTAILSSIKVDFELAPEA